ncbi:hypothetical protein ACPUVO_03260 [Pseudocolwellia sp. HL-MZ19]|uniref:hypothetical protein n=1 Tax=Pseudocolwellia sp. HL-MZ19 TaxID=3400846 RepID=UPI003CF1BC17
METAITLGIFFLGVFIPLLLIPIIERKKNNVKREESINELFVELKDIHSELIEHVESNFKLLINIRTNPDLTNQLGIPIPMPKCINIDMLGDLYKNSALLLTSHQRLAIKHIPNRVNEIMRHSQMLADSFNHKGEYCIMSIKNTIKRSSLQIHEINFLLEHKKRFIPNKGLDSNIATLLVLKSLGFSDDQIKISKIEESFFNGLKIEI